MLISRLSLWLTC
uniref:Uncharacterized protein n=1 Tax=Arundo donax TaxID=35708 RepID=A0A0A9EJ12_ARUDO